MELNRHSFLELKYVVFSLGSMEKKSVFIFPQSLLAKLVTFFGSILLFHLAFNKVDKNCIIFRYIMSLPSYQENLRILEIFIHCLTGHRFSARDWRFLRSSTVPSFSKTQSFQGLEIPESEVFFRSCIKETGLRRASVLGAACPTVLWSLIITLCVRLLKTETHKECPKTEILGFIKAAKKLDSISLGLSTFAKYIRCDKKSPKQNSFSDFNKGCLGGNLPVSSTHMAGFMITLSSFTLALLQLSKYLVCINCLVFHKLVNDGDDSAHLVRLTCLIKCNIWRVSVKCYECQRATNFNSEKSLEALVSEMSMT